MEDLKPNQSEEFKPYQTEVISNDEYYDIIAHGIDCNADTFPRKYGVATIFYQFYPESLRDILQKCNQFITSYDNALKKMSKRQLINEIKSAKCLIDCIHVRILKRMKTKRGTMNPHKTISTQSSEILESVRNMLINMLEESPVDLDELETLLCELNSRYEIILYRTVL